MVGVGILVLEVECKRVRLLKGSQVLLRAVVGCWVLGKSSQKRELDIA